MSISSGQPITAVVVGAGHRAVLLAEYALTHPDELRIIGVADPNEFRRNNVAEAHNIPKEFCFNSADELADVPKFADAAINGTMDHQHVPTTISLLRAGYDVLLEKPIATRQADMMSLLDTVLATGNTVMICHVLRYAPFYAEIRRRVLAGEIGTLVSVQTVENVSYHHMAVSHVRGKWNKKGANDITMLMAKCCHDMDLISWMKSGVAPKSVASFGSLMEFKPENAPEGSGTRCLTDCKIEDTCPYSAYKNYILQELWEFYVWDCIESMNPTTEQKIESLKTINPFGRCVWKCDNDVVDHQTVIVEFEDGSTASHNMTGGTSRPCRSMHLIGTKGEIQGVMEEGKFVVRHPDARAGGEFTEELVTLDVAEDMHGGGDMRLVEDFVRVLRGELPSISTTNLAGSIYGHMMGFESDRARIEGAVVPLDIPEALREIHTRSYAFACNAKP